ncbi:uncharacterized protein MONOS_3259 [Monocercomonoides exilis]|uniref:uncharacterized protein n=1 Tax=Monocercomonoides exilis TaxID=2049356 RepID=UPI00355A2236|nr:hypothetical protein MONOS_3259 [Monocercomonoides exilis]|eukprot:MONOS_3259.1-p1 / transcript=MONOS_3259.1 / gene=MONOS_3259 / organism=Monocercomonoides_exilis_PA203 / gene_product=unspecified product / transcript_product=unspecified product / location=Mono_scaffold00075:88894-90714(-) / protein_length=607 / sequence_SO=supercontig / SO=protein_coding / is_pseudo=false
MLGGKLKISDALFKGKFLFSGRSAFEICNEQVNNFNNCSLIGVKLNNGNGGCISVNMQIPTSTSVFLDNCTVSGECAEGRNLKGGGIFASLQSGVTSIQNTMFDECKTPSSGSEANGKGIGGGLYVYAIVDETELSLKKVIFDGCSGWKGNCVFVDGNNLSFLIKKERFSFEWAELGEKDLMGFERSTTNNSVELLLGSFLTPFEGKGFVSGDGEGLDHSGCGLRAYPCRTVPHLMKRRFQTVSSTTAEITFTSSYSIKDAFAIESYSASFESEMEGTETVIEEDGTGAADGLIETRNVVSFSCIKYSLPSQFAVERSCLILCSSSILTLQKCSAQLKGRVGKIEYNFLKVVNGEAHLNNLSLNTVKFGDICTVHIGGNDGRGIMNASEFNEVESDSSSGLIFVSNGCYFEEVNSTIRESIFEKCCSIYCENGSGMKMINSSLKNLTRKIGNGGGLTGIAGNGKIFEIKNSSFIGIRCLTTNSLGGCVFVNVGNDCGFNFESNNVSECSVSGQQGCGGGVYFSLESPSSKYTMRSIQFSQNSAKYGSDIFLLSAALRQVLQADLWDGTVLESRTVKIFGLWIHWMNAPSINQSSHISFQSPRLCYL